MAGSGIRALRLGGGRGSRLVVFVLGGRSLDIFECATWGHLWCSAALAILDHARSVGTVAGLSPSQLEVGGIVSPVSGPGTDGAWFSQRASVKSRRARPR